MCCYAMQESRHEDGTVKGFLGSWEFGLWLVDWKAFWGGTGSSESRYGGTLEYRYAETLIISYGYCLMVSQQLSIFHSSARPRVKGGFHSTIEH